MNSSLQLAVRDFSHENESDPSWDLAARSSSSTVQVNWMLDPRQEVTRKHAQEQAGETAWTRLDASAQVAVQACQAVCCEIGRSHAITDGWSVIDIDVCVPHTHTWSSQEAARALNRIHLGEGWEVDFRHVLAHRASKRASSVALEYPWSAAIDARPPPTQSMHQVTGAFARDLLIAQRWRIRSYDTI